MERRRRKVEGVCDLVDVGESKVALAALDAAVVAAIQSALERKPFLGDAAFRAQLAQRVPERGMDGRESGHANSLPS